MTASLVEDSVGVSAETGRGRHPWLRILARRGAIGLVAVWFVSAIVYWSTLVLPGDAATAILGQTATPERIAALTAQLNLDTPPLQRYLDWLTGFLTGRFGDSLANGHPVTDLVLPRLANSAVLVVATAIISTLVGIALGTYSALKRDGWFDHLVSMLSLGASALPEFVVAVFVVLTFSVSIFKWFPSASVLDPGEHIWNQPSKAVLPILTLVIVVTPYTLRMMRAATIEALNSEYVELARLKGLSDRMVVIRHAVPNALAPTIGAVGLNILYLAGGIVLVEAVFNFPGIGFALVDAVMNRDVPVIQFVVVWLAVFYVLLNILTDFAVLAVTPRRRLAR